MCCSWRPPRQPSALLCHRNCCRKSVQERWDGYEFESICLSDGYGCWRCCSVALKSEPCCHLTSALLSKYLSALAVCNPGPCTAFRSIYAIQRAREKKKKIHFLTMMTFLRIAVF